MVLGMAAPAGQLALSTGKDRGLMIPHVSIALSAPSQNRVPQLPPTVFFFYRVCLGPKGLAFLSCFRSMFTPLF